VVEPFGTDGILPLRFLFLDPDFSCSFFFPNLLYELDTLSVCSSSYLISLRFSPPISTRAMFSATVPSKVQPFFDYPYLPSFPPATQSHWNRSTRRRSNQPGVLPLCNPTFLFFLRFCYLILKRSVAASLPSPLCLSSYLKSSCTPAYATEFDDTFFASFLIPSYVPPIRIIGSTSIRYSLRSSLSSPFKPASPVPE